MGWMGATWRGCVLMLGLTLGVAVTSCGDDTEACTGEERCACYGNGTCKEGLSCLSNLCVAPSGAAGAAAGGGASSNDGGSSTAGSDGEAAGTTSGGSSSVSGGTGNESGGSSGASTQAGSSSTAGHGGEAAMAGASPTGDAGAGAGGSGQTCRSFEVYPESTVPTVFVLVDRSGSMFNCLSTSSAGSCPDPSDTPWAALKAGTLDMIQKLEGSIRFGFGTFAGEQGGSCPSFTKVNAALSNYDVIEAAYSAVAPPLKGEAPTSQVLGSLKALLAADTSPGKKYVLLVTDGEPDFCGDGNPVCAVDASVGALQALYAAGVGTMIFGVDSKLSTISAATLQAFADAGAGKPVSPPNVGATVKDQCTSEAGWLSAYTASGASGSSLGAYSSSGSATVFRPDPSDRAALTKLFATAVSGVKSCFFDLAAGLSVDLSQLDRATVRVEGELVARDDANGWRMKTPTQLELRGGACELWHDPDHHTIDFRFPCGVVVAD